MKKEQVVHRLVEAFSRVPRSSVERIKHFTEKLGVVCGKDAGHYFRGATG